MNIEECEAGLYVYVKDAEDSVDELGGGSIMREMVGSTCKIIDISSTGRSVYIQSKMHGDWWFLPSDLRLIDEEPKAKIFHFDESRL